MPWPVFCLWRCWFGNILTELQNSPIKLSIDYSSSDGIEEGDDGIWNIVGGKVRKMPVMSFPGGICYLFVLIMLYKSRNQRCFSKICQTAWEITLELKKTIIIIIIIPYIEICIQSEMTTKHSLMKLIDAGILQEKLHIGSSTKQCFWWTCEG
jgi:hypothetical protein